LSFRAEALSEAKGQRGISEILHGPNPYYVQVTAPGGGILGTSVGSSTPTPVHVTDGSFDHLYQLWSLVYKSSDSTQGYDDTTNPGGVYKVWVSQDATFPNNLSKTDNFKVKYPEGGGGPTELQHYPNLLHAG